MNHFVCYSEVFLKKSFKSRFVVLLGSPLFFCLGSSWRRLWWERSSLLLGHFLWNATSFAFGVFRLVKEIIERNRKVLYFSLHKRRYLTIEERFLDRNLDGIAAQNFASTISRFRVFEPTNFAQTAFSITTKP